MRDQTFRNAGDQIGSGAVESAVSYVVQQRMKRVGMRWRAPGADACWPSASSTGAPALGNNSGPRAGPQERMSIAPALDGWNVIC